MGSLEASRKGGADSLRDGIRQPHGDAPLVAHMQPIWHLPRSLAASQPHEADMLRTFLLLVALLIVIGIALVSTGVVNLRQDSNGSVSIETKDVEVGTTKANVQVPVVKMETRQVDVPSVGVTGNEANAQ
jgi:hypothetical protein